MIKIVSWNVKQMRLLDEAEADVVLMQECPLTVRDVPGWTVYPSAGEWTTGSASWRTGIAVRQNAGLDASEIPLTEIHDVVDGGVAMSRSGSLAAVQ